MSASHFGSGYWPEGYFGPYWQPDGAGVIVGALSGSFAGTSDLSGTLGGGVEPQAEDARSKGGFDPHYYKRRTKRPTPEPEVIEQRSAPLPDDVQPSPGIKPVTLPIGPNVMAPLVAAQVAAEYEARRIEELAEQDDEETLLLLAA